MSEQVTNHPATRQVRAHQLQRGDVLVSGVNHNHHVVGDHFNSNEERMGFYLRTPGATRAFIRYMDANEVVQVIA